MPLFKWQSSIHCLTNIYRLWGKQQYNVMYIKYLIEVKIIVKYLTMILLKN
jgi:hypothetical protein